MVSNTGKIIGVVGPTCTGKSDLALWLASKINGEIINADSMQVYKRFDIGSAKPVLDVRSQVPHHLIDVVDPDQEFNAAIFQRMADSAIRKIWSEGRTPVMVGGTGLYQRVLFHGIFEVKSSAELRQQLNQRFHDEPGAMYEELRRNDPRYAALISHNDRIRIVRALEIYYTSGVTMSQWQERHGFREDRYRVLRVGLQQERKVLYDRINKRVEQMLDRGWVREVEGILKAGYSPRLKPFQSIGYREILLYLKGDLAYPEMVEKIKTATRHYAKRQITWFSKEKEIMWNTYPEEKKIILRQVSAFLS